MNLLNYPHIYIYIWLYLNKFFINCLLIVLGFNDTSTFAGHFVLSPREREIVEEMKERDRQERKMNDSEETEEIKTFPPLPLPAARIAGLAQL